MPGRVLAVMSSLALAACSVVGIRDVEEPRHTVIGQAGAAEIRLYAPRIAAETLVDGDQIAARSIGFNRIAGYIFGGNTARAKIAMTAPVAQETPEKIAMTAPVAQDAAAAGQWRIRFFMPASYTLDTLPTPDNPEVRLVPIPAETVAVLRFTGARDAQAIAAAEKTLRAALAGSKWQPAGAAIAWFYDPPWTLPFLRRNEVALPVREG